MYVGNWSEHAISETEEMDRRQNPSISEIEEDMNKAWKLKKWTALSARSHVLLINSSRINQYTREDRS
jgi:hypothetical protein